MYHNTYVAEHVAARDRIERERAAEQANIAKLLLEQSIVEPSISPILLRLLQVVRGRNAGWLGLRNRLSALVSPSSRSH